MYGNMDIYKIHHCIYQCLHYESMQGSLEINPEFYQFFFHSVHIYEGYSFLLETACIVLHNHIMSTLQ